VGGKRVKVTQEQLEVAIGAYSKTPRPEVRLGQFLMNTLVPTENDSLIFYGTENFEEGS